MKRLLFFLLILFFTYRKKQNSNILNKEFVSNKKSISNTNKTNIESGFLQKNDSISIAFWNSYNAVEYEISYSDDGAIYVKDKNKSSIKKITSVLEVKKFVGYIDSLYIKKSVPINSRVEKTIHPVSDYSMVNVTGLDKDKIIFERQDTLFNRTCFSDLYLKFYDFLIQICKE